MYPATSLATTIAFLVVASAAGQKQDHVWYFGPTGAGLDFANCTPTVLLDGNPDATAFEGATSISDRTTGSLLFYSTGYKVYNRLRLPMPNGDPVGLSNSLAQIAIVPWPGFPEKYFLIIPEVQAGISWMPNHPAAFSLYYAVIDMALYGGLGGVASKFNVMLTTPHCEFLTAVPHANGIDYWLIGHLYNSNKLFKYAITSAGISSTPTYQNIGPVVETPQAGAPNSSSMDAVGAMRASPDGTRIAFTTAHNGITCVFDFDPTTGSLSSPLQLSIPGGAYGISFSLDASKLYVSGRSPIMGGTYEDGALFQFDLSSGEQQAIQDSRTTIHQITGFGGFTTLKLGPDGRLYVARVSSNGTSSGDLYVGVVNSPDLPGEACDYQHNGIWLGGAHGSWSLNNSIEYGHNCNDVLSVPTTECENVSISGSTGLRTVAWPCQGAFSRIMVTSIDGRCLLDKPIGDGLAQYTWSMPSSMPGTYVVTLSGGDRRTVRRFVHMP